MILIIASRFDAGAAALARRWHRHDACVLTCEMLSQRGWVFIPGDPDEGRVVLASGRTVDVRDISGAVTLLPYVGEAELPQIAKKDRPYVAAEMMAFLVAFLTALPCAVLNRPTPVCLTGPYLRPEGWLRAAAREGLRIRGVTRNIPRPLRAGSGGPLASGIGRIDETPEPYRLVVAVGRRVLADHSGEHLSASFTDAVGRLARGSGAGLLTAAFVGAGEEPELVTVTSTADVAREDVCDAMLAELMGAP